MKFSVIGCGRWGSFLAWYLGINGHEVILYGREDSPNLRQLRETGENGMLRLPDRVKLTSCLREALQNEIVLVSVPSQQLRALMQEAGPLYTGQRLFVLCMKGLEITTGLRLTQVVEQTVPPGSRTAVWLGPGHVQEFIKGVPNCMVIDSTCQSDKELLIEAFSSNLIRFYYGEDLIGSELGAAAKNIIGVAAGMLDGLALGSLKGALMSRGTREVARLILAAGGHEFSAYGLSHLGDYEATLFSPYSNNRCFGEAFVQGRPYKHLAEGVYTVKALQPLAQKLQTEMPICNTLYAILYEKADPKQALDSLFARSLKPEFSI